MLLVISGNVGKGKTLLLTILAYNFRHQYKNIVSNYTLNFPYVKFNLRDFLMKKYNNCLLLLDEMYTIMDSRNSMSTNNRISSYVLFQSRKKNLDVLGTVQLNSTIDLRYRSLCNYYIKANGLVQHNNQLYWDYQQLNTEKLTHQFISYEYAEKFYPYFDTNEIIDSVPTDAVLEHLLSKDEKIEKVQDLAQTIKAYYNNNKTITKGQIKLWLFEHKKSMHQLDLIYQKIKEMQRHE